MNGRTFDPRSFEISDAAVCVAGTSTSGSSPVERAALAMMPIR
jgi:hypothetical protein